MTVQLGFTDPSDFETLRDHVITECSYALGRARDTLEDRIYSAGDERVEALLGPLHDAAHWLSSKAQTKNDVKAARSFASSWMMAVDELESLTNHLRFDAIARSKSGRGLSADDVSHPWGN